MTLICHVLLDVHDSVVIVPKGVPELPTTNSLLLPAVALLPNITELEKSPVCASHPITTFVFPEVLIQALLNPIAILHAPTLLLNKDCTPKLILVLPDKLLKSEL